MTRRPRSVSIQAMRFLYGSGFRRKAAPTEPAKVEVSLSPSHAEAQFATNVSFHRFF